MCLEVYYSQKLPLLCVVPVSLKIHWLMFHKTFVDISLSANATIATEKFHLPQPTL